MPMYAYFGDVIWSSGRDGGYLVLGNMVYTVTLKVNFELEKMSSRYISLQYVVVTVCLKAGLITNSWTWLTHCSIWGSILLWFLFMFAYRYSSCFGIPIQFISFTFYLFLATFGHT